MFFAPRLTSLSEDMMPPTYDTIRDMKAQADQYKKLNRTKGSFWRLMLHGYSYTAQDIVKLSIDHSVAAKGQDHGMVQDFIRHYRRDAEVDPSTTDLLDLMKSYMSELDNLFFFGLLTRKSPSEELVSLKIVDGYHEAKVANFDHETCQITLYTQGKRADDAAGSPSIKFALDELIAVLAHEMVHAYVGIFPNDNNTDRYEQQVLADSGHGKMFWRQLIFITDCLTRWVPESPGFKHWHAHNVAKNRYYQ
ncbi:hypothetical protein SUNI508_04657 [Seiridium unicorne]|uniref:SprT-like domain-containing protein n=1 Tax=Seiridium unicorne TaxID=138068 RepID=A0ABR2V7V9_9PEZI